MLAVAVVVSCAPAAAQAPCASPSCEAEPERERHLGLIVTGGTFWILAYVEDIGVSAALWASVSADPENLHRDLFGASLVPVAGPWIQVGLDDVEIRRFAWGILGATQLVGLALVAIGHLVPGPADDADGPAVAVGPGHMRVRF